MESNRVECKVCKELKVKTESGVYPSLTKKNKKYVDEFQKLWSGKTCPSCNRNRLKEVMRTRILSKSDENI